MLVVGLGAAGAAAALEARAAGADVLALERASGGRRHLGDVGRRALPRRRHAAPEGVRLRGLARGDVQVPDGELRPAPRRGEDSRSTARAASTTTTGSSARACRSRPSSTRTTAASRRPTTGSSTRAPRSALALRAASRSRRRAATCRRSPGRPAALLMQKLLARASRRRGARVAGDTRVHGARARRGRRVVGRDRAALGGASARSARAAASCSRPAASSTTSACCALHAPLARALQGPRRRGGRRRQRHPARHGGGRRRAEPRHGLDLAARDAAEGDPEGHPRERARASAS